MKINRKTARLAITATGLLAAASAASAGLLWGWPAGPAPTTPAPGNTASNTAQVSGTRPYHDGSFAGPSVFQYYGYVQAKVNITNGRISSINILRYPSDYNTSIYINTHALPMLESEVIQAQSTRISGISGATLTSEAFVMSIRGALGQAAS